MPLWPLGGRNWSFIDGMDADGDYIMDAYVGPDSRVWVYWLNTGSVGHSVTIFSADFTSSVTYANPTARISSYTNERGSIVVNKNGLGVIAYQEGSITGGVGTWLRTIDEDGNFGTEVQANANYTDWPVLALYNACEDCITSDKASGEGSQRFYPFSTSTETMGSSFDSSTNSSVLFSYAGNPKAIAVDPFSNDVHFMTTGTTRNAGSPTSEPLCIIHHYQDDGVWKSDVFEPEDQVSISGGYILQGLKFEISRTGTGDIHALWTDHAYQNDANLRKRVRYAFKELNGSWDEFEMYVESIGFSAGGGTFVQGDMAIDGGDNLHIQCGGTECSMHHQSNRPDYICGYLGNGLQYFRKLNGSSMFESGEVIIKGFDLCTDGTAGLGPRTDALSIVATFTPRGFPTSDRLIVFTRVSFSDSNDSCNVKQCFLYSSNEDVWESAEAPAQEDISCGVPASVVDDSHQVYVWDDRAYTPTEVVVE